LTPQQASLQILAKYHRFIKECLIGLSPIALCRIQFNLNNSNFKREVWYSFWRNQKFVTNDWSGHGMH